MSKVAIHQPNFLPHYGFWSKLMMCDIFVILDNVQYTKGSYINRVKIHGKKEGQWLTCPIVKPNNTDLIGQVKLIDGNNWRKKHLKTIHQIYGKAKYFEKVYEILVEVYLSPYNTVQNFNTALINLIIQYLGIEKKYYHSSTIFSTSVSTQRLVDICKELDADTYICGTGSDNYQDNSLFIQNGIKVNQVSSQLEYSQFSGKFVPGLSIIDLLFHHGKNALK